MALVAAIRPKSAGSSTMGVKKSVGRGDDAGAIFLLPHRCVVGGLVADEKLLEPACGGLVGEELAQHLRSSLHPQAAAMGKARETRAVGHRLAPWDPPLVEAFACGGNVVRRCRDGYRA